MIVSSTPRIGHAAKNIVAPLAVLFVWDVGVTAIYYWHHPQLTQLEVPLSLFGTALALFLGLRDNAAYARWWEARLLWGLASNASRSMARQVVSLCDDGVAGAPPGLRRQIVRGHIAYLHQLRYVLRGQPDGAEIATFLSPEQVAGLVGKANKPNAILTATALLLGDARRAGMIDSFARVQLETTLMDLTNAQGGMERIKRTPMPSHYRFFPAFFTRIFCVILPFAVVRDLGLFTPLGSAFVGLMFLILLQIGEDLADPFSNDIHDVPMSAMCRSVEIDLLQMLGEDAPEPLAPARGVLW